MDRASTTVKAEPRHVAGILGAIGLLVLLGFLLVHACGPTPPTLVDVRVPVQFDDGSRPPAGTDVVQSVVVDGDTRQYRDSDAHYDAETGDLVIPRVRLGSTISIQLRDLVGGATYPREASRWLADQFVRETEPGIFRLPVTTFERPADLLVQLLDPNSEPIRHGEIALRSGPVVDLGSLHGEEAGRHWDPSMRGYRFQRRPAGRIGLTVHSPGYFSEVRQPILRAGQTTIVTIAMQPVAELAVTVTGEQLDPENTEIYLLGATAGGSEEPVFGVAQGYTSTTFARRIPRDGYVWVRERPLSGRAPIRQAVAPIAGRDRVEVALPPARRSDHFYFQVVDADGTPYAAEIESVNAEPVPGAVGLYRSADPVFVAEAGGFERRATIAGRYNTPEGAAPVVIPRHTPQASLRLTILDSSLQRLDPGDTIRLVARRIGRPDPVHAPAVDRRIVPEAGYGFGDSIPIPVGLIAIGIFLHRPDGEVRLIDRFDEHVADRERVTHILEIPTGRLQYGTGKPPVDVGLPVDDSRVPSTNAGEGLAIDRWSLAPFEPTWPTEFGQAIRGGPVDPVRADRLPSGAYRLQVTTVEGIDLVAHPQVASVETRVVRQDLESRRTVSAEIRFPAGLPMDRVDPEARLYRSEPDPLRLRTALDEAARRVPTLRQRVTDRGRLIDVPQQHQTLVVSDGPERILAIVPIGAQADLLAIDIPRRPLAEIRVHGDPPFPDAEPRPYADWWGEVRLFHIDPWGGYVELAAGDGAAWTLEPVGPGSTWRFGTVPAGHYVVRIGGHEYPVKVGPDGGDVHAGPGGSGYSSR